MAASWSSITGQGPRTLSVDNEGDQATTLPSELTDLDTFPLIQLVRSSIKERVDVSMSWDALRSPTVDLATVRPLMTSLLRTKHPALIYALLCNKLRFQAEAEDEIAYSQLYTTRAMICELLCIRILATYTSRPMDLVMVLTAGFSPFGGVQAEHFETHDRPSAAEIDSLQEWGKEEAANALECDAKKFIASPLCQRIVMAIYDGELTYDSIGGHSLLPDNYKRRPVQAYRVENRPILDHFLLRVPRIRAFLESITFGILAILFICVCKYHDPDRVNGWEIAFTIFAFGFALDELAQGMNGLYFADAWNSLDAAFIVLFFAFFVLRVYSLAAGDTWIRAFSWNLLSVGACLLFPRFAGSFVRDSLVFLGVQTMLKSYIKFMGVVAICVSGFVFAFYYMADGTKGWGDTAWLLLRIWLGNNFLGFNEASTFAPYLGPVLMVIYAMFTGSLLLTVLIAILSTDFADIQSNANEIFLFQRAIKTLERVKSEALHEFLPPLNILAFTVLLPSSYILSARWLHKLNVALTRTLNAPLLLLLGLYQRFQLRRRQGRLQLNGRWQTSLSQKLVNMTLEGSSDDLAVKLFEREVSEAGRTVKGMDDGEVSPVTLKKPTADNGSSFLSLPSPLLSMAPRKSDDATKPSKNSPTEGPPSQDLLDRLASLEEGQRQLLETLRALVDTQTGKTTE